jgi:hypothetical protein
MNPTMVIISWIFTILFALLLIYSWGNASKIQTPYGSMATSLPYILGLISFCGVIPGILWIITYLTAHKIDSQSNSQNKYHADLRKDNSNRTKGDLPYVILWIIVLFSALIFFLFENTSTISAFF